MANILDSIRRFFNKRKCPRYTANSGTCVIISFDKGRENMVRLIDISNGGMAFICREPQSELDLSGILKLFENSSYAAKIPFDTVSETYVMGKKQSSEPFWRRSVKFVWLGTIEKETLQNFISQIKRT